MLKIIKENQLKLQNFAQNRAIIPENIKTYTQAIINDIIKNKDAAIIKYARKWDKTDLTRMGFKTSVEAIQKAYDRLEKKDTLYIKTIKKIIKRLQNFHQHQIEKDIIVTNNADEITGQLIRPIEKVMLYVPCMDIFYPSSLLMNLVPAQCAGVKHIYITTPMRNNKPIMDEILAILYLLDIKEIYHLGSIWAIAAFAYGTENIPSVYKILGPGGIYISAAKALVRDVVDIDMIAGPSEVLIIADKNNNPEYIALDMLAQAEHDSLASAFLLTDSSNLAKKVDLKIQSLLKKYKNKSAEESIRNNGLCVIVKNIPEAFRISNTLAPEHLEILLPAPDKFLPLVQNAGSIFLGPYTPEAVGDYFAGPNHILPTMGTAKFMSQRGVYDFVKHTGFTYFSKKKLIESKKYICKIADVENLKFHSLSVKLR